MTQRSALWRSTLGRLIRPCWEVATVALHVLASGTLEERTTIIFDGSERKLIVATAHSSVGRTGARSPYKASLKNIASPGEPLVIAVYVDHSIVEARIE